MAWEPDYITVDQFKDYVKIKQEDTTDDAFIALDIAGASRSIDACCSNRQNGLGAFRQFGKSDTPLTFYYTPRWDADSARWVIETDDLISDAGLVLEVDQDNDDIYEAAITDYVLRPRDAPSKNRPYTQISIGINSSVQPYEWPDSARVTTNQWGWSAVPDVIVRATYLQAHRFNKRRVSPFGVKGSPQKQTQQNILAEVDADVEQMLRTYNMIKLGWTV